MTASLNLTTEQPVDTSAHDAAMIAKFEGTQPQSGTETSSTDRPTWLPEKFQSPEELAKAYAELEKKLGGQTPPKTEAPKPQTLQVDAQTEAAQTAVADAGLDWSALEDKVVTNGALEEGDYAALEKAGIPKVMVDNYIEGIKAQSEKITNEVLGSIGGRENFDAMASWMTQNLTPAEIESFNKVMGSRDLHSMKLAMSGMYQKYTAVAGETPKLLKPAGNNAPSGSVFRSTAELVEAMKDPRYNKDPAYRADVEARLARSEIF